MIEIAVLLSVSVLISLRQARYLRVGAASNVMFIQNAENRGEESIPFWEFFRIGAPLTLIVFYIGFF